MYDMYSDQPGDALLFYIIAIVIAFAWGIGKLKEIWKNQRNLTLPK